MKHIIILGDGMADWPAESLGNKTLLQYSSTPYMDKLAAMGRTGRLVTVAPGFHPGSEVANMSVMAIIYRRCTKPWAVGSSKHRGGVATGRYGYAL